MLRVNGSVASDSICRRSTLQKSFTVIHREGFSFGLCSGFVFDFGPCWGAGSGCLWATSQHPVPLFRGLIRGSLEDVSVLLFLPTSLEDDGFLYSGWVECCLPECAQSVTFCTLSSPQ